MQAETSTPINAILATRRSPRSYKPDHQISSSDLLALLEAARWAPSAFNGQPWRFFVGVRGDEVFTEILSSLGEFNQLWAKNASALILIGSTTTKADGSAHADYLYDCGLATAQLVYEAHDRGLIAHQMTGFSKEKARVNLEMSDEFVPVAVIAIGEQDLPEKLPEQLAEREVAKRVRLPLETIVVKGLPA
jgi:nitroreductase